ncbi:glycosyl transferase [Paracoccus tegillarcae]|uniref:Glycosyl transferase n=2 Tax=Paracoccus tegillarcae TaxID=1529068 RepID=A0A2K9EBH9_9RHOB|nr:glycosyl transferase [Paracoccus tegillarcae]
MPVDGTTPVDLPDNVLPLPGLGQPPAGRGDQATPNAPPARNLRPLGQILLEDGAISPDLLLKASILRKRQDVRLGEILLAHGWLTEEALTRALSRQWRTNTVDLAQTPPDPRLIDMLGSEFCLTNAVVPWRRTGGLTWVATARPEAFADLTDQMPAAFGHVRMLLCSEVQAQEAILATRRTALIRTAETRVPAHESCRDRVEGRSTRLALAALTILFAGISLAPFLTFSVLAGWTILTLLTAAILKLLAFDAARKEDAEQAVHRAKLASGQVTPDEMTGPFPMISVMVPLFAESDIAGKLVARLTRLTYPRELTDIVLVVEENDQITRNALADTGLPRWIRVVTVPDGPIQTKPRALNFALSFCRAQIVGVWDAEDRPEPDQLHKIARRFHFAPDNVACLQGRLDFYNPRTNWLARCFTVEYATWFRAILPGVARMGLVVPLGGTTLFFRRAALEKVGAWDAWNVTEDADLGVRLARRGYRTEIVDTTTDEEANCRALPWIKQRSRWLKGYAMTWAVHMRDPRALLRDLGPKRFIGFQVQFLGTLSQYLLAPILISFWAITAGLPHPLGPTLAHLWGGHAFTALFMLFVGAEVLNIVIGVWAVRIDKLRHLRLWVPTLHFYHPLGCLAAWKAIYEVIAKPFYWDKTAHGVFDDSHIEPVSQPGAITAAQVPDPVSRLRPTGMLPDTVGIPFLGQLDDSRALAVERQAADPAAGHRDDVTQNPDPTDMGEPQRACIPPRRKIVGMRSPGS